MNKIIKLIAGSVVVLGFASCLKDDKFKDHDFGLTPTSGNTIQIQAPNGADHNSIVSLDLKDSEVVVSKYLQVHLNAPAAPEDITVTLDTSVSAALIVGYDTTFGAELVPFTPDLFSFVNGLQVTIPAGSSDGYLEIKTNTINFDPAVTYALGFRITNIDKPGYIARDSYEEFLVLIGAKNQYDGIYELHGQFYHPTAAPGYPTFTTTVEMRTTGANSLKMFDPVFYGDYLHPFYTGTSWSAFGAQSPEYTIDPATNEVTVQNVYPGAVTFYNMGLGYNNAGYSSRYDPATKTIYDCFGYNNPGGVFDPSITRQWIDTLIYTGPR